MSENQAEGTVPVDFDWITQVFKDLKPIVEKATTVHIFAPIIQEATSLVFEKYFEFPNSRLYRPEDLARIPQHVMDCINNITPEHINYESIMVGNHWVLRPRQKQGNRKPN